MIFVRPLRPLALVAFAVAGFILRDTKLGDLVRRCVAVVGGWFEGTDFAPVVPYLGVMLAVAAAAVLIAAVLNWQAGVGAALVALAFPALLVLSGESPPATAILGWLGWLAEQAATATKGTR